MNTDLLSAESINLLEDRIHNRRHELRAPLMLAGWIWRAKAPGKAIAIRILDHSDHGVGFISPVALDIGELFDIALERTGPRHIGLHVAYCESLNEDTFRIGTHTA